MIKQVVILDKCRILALGTLAVLCFVHCDSGSFSGVFGDDGGLDSASTPDTINGSDPDTAPLTDGGDDTATSDTGEPEPGRLGEACWIEILKKWHPNYGLADCGSGLKCIGDSDEAWCTKKCQLTGELNKEDMEMGDWCCGDLAQPCDPQKYWLPPSMSFACIPRTAPLAEHCDVDSEWTGTNRRCAPICDGTSLTQETQCAQSDTGTFCTFQCDPVQGDGTCLLEPAFEGGCCGEIMGGHWCLIPSLCKGVD